MGDRHDAAIAHAASAGTLFELHQLIKQRMENLVYFMDGFEMKDGSRRSPTVLDAWLPPKSGADAQDFPFILVRPTSGNDSEQGADQRSDAKVKLVLGVYSDTDDGWTDLLNLIDAIREDLDEGPAIVGTGFECISSSWEIPEDQPRPEWFASVTTNWIVPRPLRIDARNA